MSTQVMSLADAKALLANAQLRQKTATQQVYFDARKNLSYTVTAAGPGAVRVTAVGGCVC